MRDKLVHSFGGIGIILWLLLGFALSYMPIWFLPIHGIAMVAVIAVIMFVPIVGDVLNFILWAVSFPTVLNGPQDGLAIAYYVIFAIYIIFNVIPILLGILPIIGSLGEIELIKPKYFSRETAPLRFLKVMKTLLKIGIGLQILFLIIYIIPAFGLLGEYGIGILIPYAIRIGVIVLTIATSESLEDWKWRGVNLLYLWFFIGCSLSTVNQISTQGMQWGIVIGCFLGWGIWMIPMYIYFEKRRALFTPPITAIPSDTYTQQEAQMKHFIVDESTGKVISETPVEEPKPVVLTYAPDFKLSGPPKPVVDEPVPQEPSTQPKPSNRNAVLFVVLAAICVASLAGNAVQVYLSGNTQTQLVKLKEDLADKDTLIQNLKESRSTLQKQLADAQDDINIRDNMIDEIAPEAFTMETYIGFIYDGSKYCHSYNCSQFPFEDCDRFTAHNVEYCEWLGYPKHSGCWDQ